MKDIIWEIFMENHCMVLRTGHSVGQDSTNMQKPKSTFLKWLEKDLIWNGSLKQDFIISQKTLWIIKHRFIVKIPETLEKHWELTGSA